MDSLPSFEKFKLVQNLRIENAHTNALSKLASNKDSELLTVVPIEHLLKSSITIPDVMWVERTPTWIKLIIVYLKDQVLPNNNEEAYNLGRRSTHFVFIDDVLHKGGLSSLFSDVLVGKKQLTYSERSIKVFVATT